MFPLMSHSKLTRPKQLKSSVHEPRTKKGIQVVLKNGDKDEMNKNPKKA